MYLFRILIDINGRKIEEVFNPISGELLSYNLYGLSESEYFDLINFNPNSALTTCFTSFRACFRILENSIADSPEDSAICSFMPCSAINYAVCTVMSGSGYIQGESNYIGNANCDVIYDSSGNNIK